MEFISNDNELLSVTCGPCTVASDPAGRLCYYLSCVVSIVDDLDDIVPDRLQDFVRYFLLSKQEKRKLFDICTLLSPDEFIGKCMFEDEDLCKGMANKFYELHQITNRLFVTPIVSIGSKSKQVTSIMVFQESWMRNNYYNPMQQLRGALGIPLHYNMLF